MPAENSRQPDSEDAEFEQALVEVEGYLVALQERYAQIKRDRQQYAELQQRQQQLKQQQRQEPSRHPWKTELRQIQQQLEEIELHLESRLLSWSSVKEPFWQAVRFGGIGIIIGWTLKSCIG